ncbi:MAG: SAM-dependent methyltransferase [Acidimicrobiales bacterium]
MTDRSWDEVDIDTSVAHAGRMYDYMLGGTTNFAVDREACTEANRDFPGGIEAAKAGLRANRDFLGRAVRHIAEAGVHQFLDLGTGIPSDDNTHAVALSVAPDSRIVYVDNDPIVLAHAHQLLQSTPESATSYLFGDMRDVETVLTRASATLDFTQPIGLILVAILHFVTDDEDPYGLVSKLMDAVPSGSYLAVSHLAGDIMAEEMEALYSRISERTKETFVLRSRGDVARFFDGLDLVEPGVALVSDWHVDAPGAIELPVYAAVGIKP